MEIIEKEKLYIYEKLFESLSDFGQDKRTPLQKIDFVKARVFDALVSLKRIGVNQS